MGFKLEVKLGTELSSKERQQCRDLCLRQDGYMWPSLQDNPSFATVCLAKDSNDILLGWSLITTYKPLEYYSDYGYLWPKDKKNDFLMVYVRKENRKRGLGFLLVDLILRFHDNNVNVFSADDKVKKFYSYIEGYNKTYNCIYMSKRNGKNRKPTSSV